MVKKRYSVFAFILLALVISGCNNKDSESPGQFVGGVKGVDIYFVDGAPFNEFVQGRDVPIGILLKNVGEYDIAANMAEVQLYGLPLEDEYNLNSNYKKVEGQLRGIKKGFLEEGGEQTVNMGTLNYGRKVSGFTDKSLFARVCYPYMTKAMVTSCATSKNIQLVEEGGVCTTLGEKLVDGSVSSAPVQVTSFTEQLSGVNSVSFKIVISNLGKGNVYAFDSICSNLNDPVVLSAKKNLVKLTVLPEDIKCNFVDGESNEGFVRLGDAPKNVICTMEVSGSSSYERDIDLYLDYKYTEDTSVNMRILGA